MDEPDQPGNPQEESLAAVPPTPVAESSVPLAGNIGLGVIAWTAAGAGTLVMIAGTMTPCMGATRSTTLEWERRWLQIEQAEREFEDDCQRNAKIASQPDGTSDARRNVSNQD